MIELQWSIGYRVGCATENLHRRVNHLRHRHIEILTYRQPHIFIRPSYRWIASYPTDRSHPIRPIDRIPSYR